MLHTIYEAPSSGRWKLQEASKQKASPSTLCPFWWVKCLRLLRASHDQIWCCRQPVDMSEVWVTAAAEKNCVPLSPSQGIWTLFSRNNKHVCNVSNRILAVLWQKCDLFYQWQSFSLMTGRSSHSLPLWFRHFMLLYQKYVTLNVGPCREARGLLKIAV